MLALANYDSDRALCLGWIGGALNVWIPTFLSVYGDAIRSAHWTWQVLLLGGIVLFAGMSFAVPGMISDYFLRKT